MNQERLKFLLDRYFQNECKQAEIDEINKWFDARGFDTTKFEGCLQKEVEAEQASVVLFNDFKIRLQPKKKTIRFKLLSTAAIFLLVFIGGLLFLRYKYDLNNEDQIKKICEIKPGVNKAVLTLADGSKILLSDKGNGAIGSQNNITINKTGIDQVTYNLNQMESANSKTQYNTMTTPRGGRYSLILADGTEVMLDAASSITYPVAFNGNQRKLSVTGQVFFKVVHNAKKPFSVSAKGQIIEDLGTSFNVNAYDDDKIVYITLVEGNANVSNALHRVNLNPGQQAFVKEGSDEIAVKTVNLDEITAWTTGWFKFHNKSIREVMKEAGRWYDVEVEFQKDIDEKKIGGTISRYKNISELLDNLKITGNINYQIKGRRVTLTN